MAIRQALSKTASVAICVWVNVAFTWGMSRPGALPPHIVPKQRPLGPQRPQFVEYMHACQESDGVWNTSAGRADNSALLPALMRLMLSDPSLNDNDKEILKITLCRNCAGNGGACDIARSDYKCIVSGKRMKAWFVFHGAFDKDPMVNDAVIHGTTGRSKSILRNVQARRLNKTAYAVTVDTEVKEYNAVYFSVNIMPCEWCVTEYVSCELVHRVSWSPFATYNILDAVRLFAEKRYLGFFWVYAIITTRVLLCLYVLADIGFTFNWFADHYDAILVAVIIVCLMIMWSLLRPVVWLRDVILESMEINVL
ncbi:membrane protein A29 [Aotine betaherpesvirus 1]|uniref:Membrane protein A29 n=1 Tax=Aotine betaherpesvirus 1 TaxID=50290 RepID=G8XUK3_9BETA|nr:membrane protein A29 [Aotine betaherpesvirus 1]AEV80845.1 membrane protein A29 [Aotine betaherpesvirus 1]